MTARLAALLTASLIGVAGLAGCGSSSSSSSSTQATTASTSAATTPSTPSTTGGIAAATVGAVCSNVVRETPAISAAERSKVESICSKLAAGDKAGARKLGEEVCQEILKSPALPAGDRERAVAACKTAFSTLTK